MSPQFWNPVVSLDVLIRPESLAILKEGERKASQVEDRTLVSSSCQDLGNCGASLLLSVNMVSSFLDPLPSPSLVLKKKKMGGGVRKNYDLLRNQNVNHKSLQG